MALTAERLRQLLDYNPETGEFRWRVKHSLRIRSGDLAGFSGAVGYRQIRVDGVVYYEHRLAWMHQFGEFPSVQLDHINGDRSDNRISNLRVATNRQNAANGRSRRTGLKGAVLDKRNNRWRAYIKRNGATEYLGTFKCEMDAHNAYTLAAYELFGEFANGGR